MSQGDSGSESQSSMHNFHFLSLSVEGKDSSCLSSEERLINYIARKMVYQYYLGSLPMNVCYNMTVGKNSKRGTKGRPLIVKDVHIRWINLLGVNRQLRQEVASLL